MASRIGVDIEELRHFRKKDAQLLDILFTDAEISECQKKEGPHACFTEKFCAKEAVAKALGKPIELKDIEISEMQGRIAIFIKGKKQKRIFCSVSHSGKHALALCAIDA